MTDLRCSNLASENVFQLFVMLDATLCDLLGNTESQFIHMKQMKVIQSVAVSQYKQYKLK